MIIKFQKIVSEPTRPFSYPSQRNQKKKTNPEKTDQTEEFIRSKKPKHQNNRQIKQKNQDSDKYIPEEH